MAKQFVPKLKKEAYTAFPSPYGSHQSMVDQEATKQLDQAGKVVCKDDFGYYITENDRLDIGMADPHRNADVDWRGKQLAKYGLGHLAKKQE